MSKVVKSENKFESSKYFIEHGIDLEKRRIMLDEEIDEVVVGRIIRGLKKMADISSEEPIDFYISSFGGCVYSTFALYDAIRSLDVLVRTKVLGKAMSGAFILLLAGDERYAGKNTRLMNHTLGGGVDAKLFEIETTVEEYRKLEEMFLDILAERTKKDRKWWKKEAEFRDCYYSKSEALKLGVLTHEEEP